MTVWDLLKGLLPNYERRQNVRNAIRDSLIEAKKDLDDGEWPGIGKNPNAGTLSTESLNEYHELVNTIQNYPLEDYSEEELKTEINNFIAKLDRANTIDTVKKYVSLLVLLVVGFLITSGLLLSLVSLAL